MRWNPPVPGTEVWTKKFALFPKKVGDITIWLEYYYRLTSYYENWEGITQSMSRTLLPEHADVQTYLISQTPLGKALSEAMDSTDEI